MHPLIAGALVGEARRASRKRRSASACVASISSSPVIVTSAEETQLSARIHSPDWYSSAARRRSVAASPAVSQCGCPVVAPAASSNAPAMATDGDAIGTGRCGDVALHDQFLIAFITRRLRTVQFDSVHHAIRGDSFGERVPPNGDARWPLPHWRPQGHARPLRALAAHDTPIQMPLARCITCSQQTVNRWGCSRSRLEPAGRRKPITLPYHRHSSRWATSATSDRHHQPCQTCTISHAREP